MILRTTLFTLLLLPVFLLAQRQANHWHFGDSLSVSFTTGEPVLNPPTSMGSLEGCAAQSDEQGNLLFYTNGGGMPPPNNSLNSGLIWNRNHDEMYDMNGAEGGGSSSAQSSIVIPVPGSLDRYYLFTMEELEFNIGGGFPDQPLGRGLSYFIIDMNLNGGLGGVEVADERVFTPAYEGVTAVKMRGDQEGHWIITHTADTSWVVVPVTEAGVGAAVLYDLGPADDIDGIIKASPDGNWLVCNKLLFAFDPVNGVPATSSTFFFGDISNQTVSFTPDSRFLYSVLTDFTGKSVIRFDITAADIAASAGILGLIPIGFFTYQMEMAPNGSIYFLESDFGVGTVGLSEIACPSNTLPVLTRLKIDLSSADDPFFGLPNYPSDIFATLASQNDTNFVVNDSLIVCPDTEVTFSPVNTGMEYAWSTGSMDSIIQVSQPGTYEVTVTGGCQTAVESFFLDNSNDTIILKTDSLLECPQTSITLFPITEGIGYAWSTGSAAVTIDVIDPGLYTVTVTESCQTTIESFLLENTELISGAIEPLTVADPTTLCLGQDTISLTFQSSVLPDELTWFVSSPGSNETAFTVDTLLLPVVDFERLVVLELQGDCISFRDSISFLPPENFQAELTTDAGSRLCPGDEVTLFISGTNVEAVIWEDGSSELTRVLDMADSTINYSATVFDGCGDSILLTADLDYSNCPQICDAKIPDLITPNNDGTNDLFRLFSSCPVLDFQLLIFNRWGQVVYDTNNPTIGWDGTKDGQPQPMDVYLYRIRYRFEDDVDVRESDGQFSLVR